ncbi:MAG: DUF1236 domain-containing protein [Mesorhizobium sp.]|uniref:DUF1236 domain-containing protein n=1 Tax=Mesorhizobium sp. TaxID=1871066 RepID=UPI000FEA701F|nr:DUF1236 domain-containing protein [Mesorhizobium sp.]RWH82050.1 MAG: DUF1236 domain-containing protein [Mesorhizobium sp.]RWH85049.1 MAG: DUF1236 domain-containing protein [Mesorhizobium sp.]RWH89805.1 MAG: DUF1236 domain-containing protein [Mesorhizobium sp.]RWH98446.1 MAG: DUF1236 domain-containing protein [Mesorhizobium sp.]RWI04546.1 MAG: DUF1236 domain-containing protein [Mesorhizobium sp.]
MKKVLITSMLAIGVGCGAAFAQEQQPAQTQSGADCPAGSAGCPEGTMGEQSQGKAGATTEEQAQGKAKMQTDEQAQGKAGVTTEQQTQGEAGATTEQQTQGEAGTTTEQQTQGTTSTQPQDETSTGAISNVTVEQKTEITQILKQEKVEPVASVDFDIAVGVEVPRQKVKLRRLPPRIVEIVPAYESYEYFVLADGRIVIVDPDTLTIVLILT